MKIVDLNLISLSKKYAKRGIHIDYDNSIKHKIIELCDYENFGARKVQKVMQNYIESFIIDKVIEGQYDILLSEKELLFT